MFPMSQRTAGQYPARNGAPAGAPASQSAHTGNPARRTGPAGKAHVVAVILDDAAELFDRADDSQSRHFALRALLDARRHLAKLIAELSAELS